jgi:hypothetical protein
LVEQVVVAPSQVTELLSALHVVPVQESTWFPAKQDRSQGGKGEEQM